MTVYKKILNSLGPNKALIVCRELGISINTSDNKLSSEKAEQLSKLLLILKKDNLLLNERIEKLEKLINDMISYQPNGEGYQETKTHFETISMK